MTMQKITIGMTPTTTNIILTQTIRCQLLMKVTHMKPTPIITIMHQQEIIRLIECIVHISTPQIKNEDKHVQQEIQNVSENNKQITHEMNRLQDQFRYLLQNITERNLLQQENKETNKKDFDQSNSRICEPQDVKGIKCEDPQITKNKTSSSSSSHDIEGNEETYRNNIDKINSNNNLEILDDNSKAELDVQDTH